MLRGGWSLCLGGALSTGHCKAINIVNDNISRLFRNTLIGESYAVQFDQPKDMLLVMNLPLGLEGVSVPEGGSFLQALAARGTKRTEVQ